LAIPHRTSSSANTGNGSARSITINTPTGSARAWALSSASPWYSPYSPLRRKRRPTASAGGSLLAASRGRDLVTLRSVPSLHPARPGAKAPPPRLAERLWKQERFTAPLARALFGAPSFPRDVVNVGLFVRYGVGVALALVARQAGRHEVGRLGAPRGVKPSYRYRPRLPSIFPRAPFEQPPAPVARVFARPDSFVQVVSLLVDLAARSRKRVVRRVNDVPHASIVSHAREGKASWP
jgi:hypothetical protein